MQNFFNKIYHSKPIYNYKKIWFLALVCLLFVILRFPSLVEPNWYGDEGIYQVVGREIYKGATLYKDIWDNKPPILYLIYALFNSNLFFVKLVSLVFGFLSVISFYFLSRKAFYKSKAKYIATLIFAILFGLPLLEGNIANAENFMLLPIILSAFLVLSYVKEKRNIKLFIAGLLLSFAFMTKIVAIFDFSAFILFILISSIRYEKININKISFKEIKPFIIFALSFVSVLVVFVIYFITKKSLNDFFTSIFLQNVSYVGYQNDLLFPMGALVLKTILLIIALFIIFLRRRKLSFTTVFIYIWLLFSLYNALFSQRPYTHYLLVILPSFSLLCAQFFSSNKTKIINGILIIATVLISLFFVGLYQNTFSYYVNFFKFITNQESVFAYESFFDVTTPVNYEIAGFIKNHTNDDDKVFLWSDNAQIYILSNKLPIGKYIVAYHILSIPGALDETRVEIEKLKPKYIIQTIDEPFTNDLVEQYQLKYNISGVKIYERTI